MASQSLFLEHRILDEEFAGSDTFKAFNDVGWSFFGMTRDEDMTVIRHDFHLLDLEFEVLGNFIEKLL